MINFTKLNLTESLALDAEQSSSEMAKGSVEKKMSPLSRQRQKDQMAQRTAPAKKSDVVYASEDYFNELRDKIEHRKAQDAARSDWRSDIKEAVGERPQDEGDHPYVDIMPHTKKLPKKAHGNTKPENREKQDDQAMAEQTLMEISVGKALAAGRASRKKAEKSGDTNDRLKAVKTTNRALAKRDKRDANYMKSMYPGLEESNMEFDEAFGKLLESDWRPEGLKVSQDHFKKLRDLRRGDKNSKREMGQLGRTGPSANDQRDNRNDAQKMADAYKSPRKGPGGATKAD